MAEVETGLRVYLKFILKDRAALASLIVIAFLVGVAAYVSTWPSSVAFNYLNRLQYWESLYPADAAPSWMVYFEPAAYTPTLYLSPSSVILNYSAGNVYIYKLTYSFSWPSLKAPTDVSFSFSGNATISQILIVWRKPSGSEVNMSVTVGSTTSNFDLVGVQKALLSYIYERTGTMPTFVTSDVLAKALFNSLSSSGIGPAERGTYTVTVYLVTQGPEKLSQAEIRILGNAYGYMGTDYYGRPILLGILLGLPNALEMGLLASLLAVLIGVLVGGYSGYLGGKADSFINWFSMVVLALPALPFLVALGLWLRSSLSLWVEVLLITFLSWPFYAIIARSSAQSIRTSAFVEADRLLGIPSYRTFFTHFMPRLTPFTVAYTVLGIPGVILLVQSLAFIGIAPPNLVTWGYLLDQAYANNAALNGWWWWILFPGLMIVVVAMPFVIVGFAIERAAFGGR
ncbi:MAG: ABC-type dipeptide/oligopeptide/nickel transport system, permease component [uncultured Acidilobus sp. JCHS]|nr:MAG: ABC-type dipeptide/oligopeptide/nickel transport system, permease component [uncultured Acidilobus sp. JCHS]